MVTGSTRRILICSTGFRPNISIVVWVGSWPRYLLNGRWYTGKTTAYLINRTEHNTAMLMIRRYHRELSQLTEYQSSIWICTLWGHLHHQLPVTKHALRAQLQISLTTVMLSIIHAAANLGRNLHIHRTCGRKCALASFSLCSHQPSSHHH